MDKLELLPFDAAKHLTDPTDQADLLNEALATGDAKYIAHALGVVARARGISSIAGDAGIARQSLYRALSKDGNPTLDTVARVLASLGLQLAVRPAA